ncbi:hypothetical protein DL771_007615 [Monosporascus sp. 5C6A]|nr:hypothetical protein DL771_007615 [Monosporascus sp. 5C6A]
MADKSASSANANANAESIDEALHRLSKKPGVKAWLMLDRSTGAVLKTNGQIASVRPARSTTTNSGNDSSNNNNNSNGSSNGNNNPSSAATIAAVATTSAATAGITTVAGGSSFSTDVSANSNNEAQAAQELAALVWGFLSSAGSLVDEVDAEDELKLLRLRTKKQEVVIVPEHKYLLVVIHDTPPVQRQQFDFGLAQDINSKGLSPEGAYAVVSLLDRFTHHGPSGEHYLPRFRTAESSRPDHAATQTPVSARSELGPRGCPLRISRRVLRDTIAGLKTLHATGVAYGDLDLGDLLFTLWDTDGVPGEQIPAVDHQRYGAETAGPRAYDRWYPRHVFEPKQLLEYARIDEDRVPLVEIADLGLVKRAPLHLGNEYSQHRPSVP